MKSQIITEKQEELLKLLKTAADKVRELADTGKFQAIKHDRRMRSR